MEIQQSMTIKEKLEILSDAAKYDVACTSSGNDRAAVKGSLGSACASGICHTFTPDGRCVSLLKILMTNECVYDCKYCVNRRSNDVRRAIFTPEEICTLTIEFYRRNYIEGLFLSSGVYGSPNRTMELLYESLYLLRYKYRFMGYIHVKGIPGADALLLEKVGFLADRMSMNLELPTSEGLKALAPSKKEESILGGVKHIQEGIHGTGQYCNSAYETTRIRLGSRTPDIHALWEQAVPKEQLTATEREITDAQANGKIITSSGALTATGAKTAPKTMWLPEKTHLQDRQWMADGRLSKFVPAGQSTQMIIGATRETDFDIMTKAELLYQSYDLKRVFYSAFINITHDSALPENPDGPPLLREHRLYQADFLLRYYGFVAGELLSPDRPNLHPLLDPKCGWALRHLELFPVEVEKADYGTLLRVPGIGPKSAERIVKARRTGRLDYDALKRMGVVLKRAHYFILCHGQQMFRTRIEERFITNEMISMDREKNWKTARQENFRQMNLFADLGMKAERM